MKKGTYFGIIFWALCLGGTSLKGQAYCALRDPVASINELYPEATSFKSIVGTIDQNIRSEVARRLPPHMLHYGELGRHTLYVALKEEQPLGLVHVRSESSKWGLIEVAWALDLDLKINGFSFQRCRDKGKELLLTEEFQSQLRGKGFTELSTFINDPKSRESLRIPSGAEDLTDIVIRCGLKTILVTSLAWEKDLDSIRLKSQVATFLPDASSIVSVLQSTEVVHTKEVALEQVYQVKDQDNSIAGVLCFSQIMIEDERVPIKWIFDHKGIVLDVEAVTQWPDERVHGYFADLIQQSASEKENCSTQAGLVAQEIETRIARWLE